MATGSCLSAARRPAQWVVVFHSSAATDGGGVAEFFFSGFFPIKFQMDNKSPLDQLCDKNKVEIATIAAHWMLEISGKQVKISNTRHLGP